MRERDLNAFLASVRRTRFVDYLDPMGETAQNAFERRLQWARANQHEPSHGDEARFLVENAHDLREILRTELEESDWVEEADVGQEFEVRRPLLSNRGRSAPRHPDAAHRDLDEGSSSSLSTEIQPARRQKRTVEPPPRAQQQRAAPAPSRAPARTGDVPQWGRSGQAPTQRLGAFPSADLPYDSGHGAGDGD